MQVIVWEIEYAICIDDDDSWDRESQSVLGGEDALTAVMAVRESILGRKISGTLDSDFAGGPEEEFEYKLTDFKLLAGMKAPRATLRAHPAEGFFRSTGRRLETEVVETGSDGSGEPDPGRPGHGRRHEPGTERG